MAPRAGGERDRRLPRLAGRGQDHDRGQARRSIVSIASIAGKIGEPGLAHYAASKFALVGFTQALARELAPHQITVNAVCPGVVLTR